MTRTKRTVIYQQPSVLVDWFLNHKEKINRYEKRKPARFVQQYNFISLQALAFSILISKQD